MSEAHRSDTGAGAPTSTIPPTLALLTHQIAEELVEHEALGLLSISVLQKHRHDDAAQWSAYEGVLREINRYLDVYLEQELRSTDRRFGPSINGNGFVILLDRPRGNRVLDPTDVARVRLRVRNGVRAHLARRLDDVTLGSFGCYVGGAVMRDRPEIVIERVVYRALESAFADALRDREREDRRNLVNLHRVMECGQIHVLYPALRDITGGHRVGIGAVCRAPRTRFSSHTEMLLVARDNDVLPRLERLMRTRALDGLPTLLREQLVALQVQPESLDDPELGSPTFRERLDRAGITSEQLVLEINARLSPTDPAELPQIVGRLRAHGYRLAVSGIDPRSPTSSIDLARVAPDFLTVDDALGESGRDGKLAGLVRLAEEHGIRLLTRDAVDDRTMRETTQDR